MKQYTISENDAGQRLDKFLKKLLVNASVSLIYKINRKDKVKVNKKRQDNEYKLQVGDEIKIFLTDNEFDELTIPHAKPISTGDGNLGPKFDKKDIVYEDSDLLIINKNPGINVHPGDHKTSESNVISQIQDYLGDKLNSLTFKPSLVHRIDRDTSGILLIGKKKEMLTKLVEDFKHHDKVKKTYYTIVLGHLKEKSGTITKKILRIENAKNENKVQISDAGQEAITKYKVLGEKILKTKNGDLPISEVEVEILTGRMHQIRIHFSHLGHPVLGDNTYGDKQLNSYLSKNFGLERQALHAWKIEFFHHIKNKKLNFEAKIKPDLVEFIGKI